MVRSIPLELAPEPRVRVRSAWAFLWAAHDWSIALESLRHTGLGLAEVMRADALVPRHLLIRALGDYVRASGDSAIGERAGKHVQPGDFDIVEFVVRGCESLRDAILAACRHAPLIDEVAELSLIEDADSATWRFGLARECISHRAAEDFALIGALTLLQFYVGEGGKPVEVHLAHGGPRELRALAGTGVRVRSGMEHSALVFDRHQLDQPMPRANAPVQEIFEQVAEDLWEQRTGLLRRRVGTVVADELRAGRLTMHAVARRLGASAPTLRRRLHHEGVTFRQVVNEVRRELAKQYLADSQRRIGEIARALGFANLGTFDRAFRRWYAVGPSEYRAGLLHAQNDLDGFSATRSGPDDERR